MKKIITSIFTFLILINISSCQSNDSKKINSEQVDSTGKVQGYYFHRTRRCLTCKTVEEVTQEILMENYALELADSTISFKSVNIEENDGKKLAKDMMVSGQALLFVSNIDTVNLTNQAFMNAVNNPLKLSTIITDEIDRMLK